MKFVNFFKGMLDPFFTSLFAVILGVKAFDPKDFFKGIEAPKGTFHAALFPSVFALRATDVGLAWTEFALLRNKNLGSLLKVLLKTGQGIIEGLAIFVLKTIAPFLFLASTLAGVAEQLFNVGKHLYQGLASEKGSTERANHFKMAKAHTIGAVISGGFALGVGLLMAFPVTKAAWIITTGTYAAVSGLLGVVMSIKQSVTLYRQAKHETKKAIELADTANESTSYLENFKKRYASSSLQVNKSNENEQEIRVVTEPTTWQKVKSFFAGPFNFLGGYYDTKPVAKNQEASLLTNQINSPSDSIISKLQNKFDTLGNEIKKGGMLETEKRVAKRQALSEVSSILEKSTQDKTKTEEVAKDLKKFEINRNANKNISQSFFKQTSATDRLIDEALTNIASNLNLPIKSS